MCSAMRFAAMLSFLLLAALTSSSWATTVNNKIVYLTPNIRSGYLNAAREDARVTTDKWTFESYSGYLTVDDTYNSNMYFWFIPAINRPTKDAPVLLWLEGDLVRSSLFGAFEEHGPISITGEETVEMRADTWASTHSMLYMDNPVGSGFSFTDDKAGYSSNQMAVTSNLYGALVQFFTLFSEYQTNDFYVTGELYASKYAVAVSYAIHKNNPSALVKINLKGLVISNGLVDPITQLTYSDFLYQHGFIDESGKSQFETEETLFRDRIKLENFTGAMDVLNKMMFNRDSLFTKLTRLNSKLNMLWEGNTMKNVAQHKYDAFGPILHLNMRMNQTPEIGRKHLRGELMRSTKQLLSALVDDGKYRVLLYSGQLDILIPYRSTMNMARSLVWKGAEEFRNATRAVWWVPARSANNTDHPVTLVVAGYATSFGPLTVLLIRNAGHFVPLDQQSRALKMINHFTSGQSFSDPINISSQQENKINS